MIVGWHPSNFFELERVYDSLMLYCEKQDLFFYYSILCYCIIVSLIFSKFDTTSSTSICNFFAGQDLKSNGVNQQFDKLTRNMQGKTNEKD